MMYIMYVKDARDGAGSSFGFAAFQTEWHRWMLGVQGHRGRAAEIALKNLERGLKGRHAATLVGDAGAAPRVLGLLAAFAADAHARLGARLGAPSAADAARILGEVEEQLGRAAREIAMVTHDRPEALATSEFLARVAFRLLFREVLLPPTPLYVKHPLDRPTMPSLVWRAVDAVNRRLAVPFLRRAVRDAERLCGLQQQHAPLGGELGGAGRLDPEGDLADLGGDHTQRLPTPNTDETKRELFGLSGGLSAVLPAALYLSWKYERNLGAALTANVMLGGNAAGRGVLLGALLGARAGSAALPGAWLAQLGAAEPARRSLGALGPERHASRGGAMLRYEPCPPELCGTADASSDILTSQDVRIVAALAGSSRRLGAGSDRDERSLVVRLNVSNTGASGLPICPHGRLWLLWEAGGFARGRFQDVGGGAAATTAEAAADLADGCLAPGEWAALPNVVSSVVVSSVTYKR